MARTCIFRRLSNVFILTSIWSVARFPIKYASVSYFKLLFSQQIYIQNAYHCRTWLQYVTYQFITSNRWSFNFLTFWWMPICSIDPQNGNEFTVLSIRSLLKYCLQNLPLLIWLHSGTRSPCSVWRIPLGYLRCTYTKLIIDISSATLRLNYLNHLEWCWWFGQPARVVCSNCYGSARWSTFTWNRNIAIYPSIHLSIQEPYVCFL